MLIMLLYPYVQKWLQVGYIVYAVVSYFKSI